MLKEIEMATQKDNLLVLLLKRSVGMGGSSGCCGAPAACGCASSASAATAPAAEEAAPPAAPKPNADTARSDTAGPSGCC